jgi:hypothetical protein
MLKRTRSNGILDPTTGNSAPHLGSLAHAQSFVGTGLTLTLWFVYARRYDYEIFCPHSCNRICGRFYCPSSVADSGRITRSITNACKASRSQKSPRDDLASRVAFARCLAGEFAEREARGQKIAGYGSGPSDAFIIAC